MAKRNALNVLLRHTAIDNKDFIEIILIYYIFNS